MAPRVIEATETSMDSQLPTMDSSQPGLVNENNGDPFSVAAEGLASKAIATTITEVYLTLLMTSIVLALSCM